MFKLESKNLKREFKVIDGALFASQITNTESGMQFIPDGNDFRLLKVPKRTADCSFVLKRLWEQALQ